MLQSSIVQDIEKPYQTEEISLEIVKKRVVSGVAVLLTRNFILQIIGFIAFGFFGAFLATAEFGVYAVVLAIKSFFAYFSDIGLAAALIQKKEKVTDVDLKTTFTIQQALVIIIIIIIFLLTSILQKIYGLSKEGVYLLWALSISLLFSSLKTIPSVLLERRLEFKKLVLPQVVEVVLFNAIAVFLAWQGFGLTSFTVAILVSGFIGMIIIYIIEPWMPGFAFSYDALRRLLRFGIPYQANTFLAMVKDDGLTVFLGGILGLSGLGLYAWAQKWANMALRFVMDPVIKVTFPAYSRLQDHREDLARAVSKSIFYVCFIAFPSIAGLVLVAPALIQAIPQYEKWQPALLALGLFGVNGFWAAVTTPLTNLLNAIGKIKITFGLMVMWTILSWVLIPVLAVLFGVNGAAFGSALVGTTSIVAILIVRRFVPFEIVNSVVKPFFATLVMAGVLLPAREVLPSSLFGFFTLVVLGFLVYGFAIFLFVGQTVFSDTRKIFKALRKV